MALNQDATDLSPLAGMFCYFIDRITKTLMNYRFDCDNIDKMHNISS